jgi:hypothetical protein
VEDADQLRVCWDWGCWWGIELEVLLALSIFFVYFMTLTDKFHKLAQAKTCYARNKLKNMYEIVQKEY